MNSKKLNISSMVQCSLFAALLCVMCPVTFPVGAVPVSLGMLALMLSAVVMGSYKSVVALAVYLLIGVLGLPVFAGGQAGVSVLAGPTGGYLWSYLPVSVIIGSASSRGGGRYALLAACAAALVVCYICGTVQFMLVTKTDLTAALAVCVYPFVVFDIIKAVCAVILGHNIRRRLVKSGLIV